METDFYICVMTRFIKLSSMKILTAVWSKSCLILILLCISSVSVNGKNDLKHLSDYLDRIINNKEQFNQQKETDINNLKKLLVKKGSSAEYIYEINQKLCDEYKKFKVDSAIHYAKKNVEIANSLNSRYKIYQSEIFLANMYSYSSKFLESENILKDIHSKDLPRALLPQYYDTYSRFYEHYVAISNQGNYHRLVENYRDSLLSVLDPSSFIYQSNMVHKYINENKIDTAENLLLNILETVEIDSPEYALITHYLGSVSTRRNLPEQEKMYFTMSAIADIKNSIKENASCQRLALIYYNEGDLSKSFKYAQSAIEDALFSGVQFRTAEMSEFYSIINATHQAKEAKTNSQLKTYLVLISILFIFVTLLVVYIYKQMKKVSQIKEQLSESNGKLKGLIEELNNTNNLLNERNEQLSESNFVKEQYITQFFHQCSSYIESMEENRKTLYKLAVNKQFDNLVKKLKSTSAVESELDDLYALFDSIFLSLYPTFVADFNSLLTKEEQIHLKSDGLLTRELRIYALLRLGITDGAQISSFLRCSLSTIYNYRSKMRNKASCNRDQFEDMVMKIGISKPNQPTEG